MTKIRDNSEACPNVKARPKGSSCHFQNCWEGRNEDDFQYLIIQTLARGRKDTEMAY